MWGRPVAQAQGPQLHTYLGTVHRAVQGTAVRIKKKRELQGAQGSWGQVARKVSSYLKPLSLAPCLLPCPSQVRWLGCLRPHPGWAGPRVPLIPCPTHCCRLSLPLALGWAAVAVQSGQQGSL